MIAPIPSRNLVRLTAVLAGLVLLCGGALAQRYAVPLLAPPGASGEPEGVLRIVNSAAESGTVSIYAIDDAGVRSGPATFTLDASAAAEFTAAELQSGNAARGLDGGIGAAAGDARLVIETDLDIVPLAFVRAADGTLSAMNETVLATAAQAGQYRYDVPVFNPAADAVQASRLRLINTGDTAAAVTIAGLDDGGAAASGGEVTLTLPAGAARTLDATQIEAGGAGLTGQLGAPGLGRWRLTVTADHPLQVMNIVAAPAGYWSNLSAAATSIGTATSTSSSIATADSIAISIDGLTQSALAGAVGAPTRNLPPGTPGSSLEAATGRLGAGGTTTTAGAIGTTTTASAIGTTATAGAIGTTATAGAFGTTPTTTGFGMIYAPAATTPGFLNVPQDMDDEGVAPSFDLDAANGRPEGIAWSDGRLHVVDRTADKVFAYGVEGYAYVPPEFRRQPSQDFDLDGDNGSPTGIAWSGDSFHVVDLGDRKVYAYAYSGQRLADADFDLDAENTRPEGIVWADRRFYVADNSADKVFAYGTDGQRDAEADFDLLDGNGFPSGLAYAGGRFYVADGTDGKVYAYGAGGVREAEYDFDLREGNSQSDGLVWADGRFRAVDADEDKVFVYPAPVVPPAGGQTVYAAGDAILSLSATASLTLGDGDYAERHGYRYTCRSPAGCEVAGGAVASGSVARTQAGVVADDAEPEFPAGTSLEDLSVPAGEPIEALTFPEASGGDGALTYSLSPEVPGLSFDPVERQLTGTPTVIANYDMTYSGADTDGDAATLTFTLAVKEPTSFRLGEDNGWARGVVRAGDLFYIVDDNSDRVYAYGADWKRNTSGDFALDAENTSPRGIAWDGARFYVTDHIDDKVYAYGADGQRAASADLALDADNAVARGIAWADGRFHVVDLSGRKVFAYGADGQRAASADFDLDAANRGPHGIAWVDGRFHVTDYIADKIFAYGADGQRDASADLALESTNTFSVGIAWGDGRFHVVDSIRDRAFLVDAP